jgi:hypothetical protein
MTGSAVPRNRGAVVVSLAALAGLLLLAAPAARAAGPLTAGQMALNGYWGNAPATGPAPVAPPVRAATTAPPPTPPGNGGGRVTIMDLIRPKMLPRTVEETAKFAAALAAGVYRPTAFMRCYPATVPGVAGGGLYGTEVLVEPATVTFLYDSNRVARIVYIDQQHPANLEPSWLGHTIGHWEGDTLVTDTIGFNDKITLNPGVDVPITHQMHVVQRVRVVNGALEIQGVLDDPGAFTSSFTITNTFKRGTPFPETICPENNLEGGVATSDGGTTPYRVE